jgi:hypothetical protein
MRRRGPVTLVLAVLGGGLVVGAWLDRGAVAGQPELAFPLLDQLGAAVVAVAADGRQVYLAEGSRIVAWEVPDGGPARELGRSRVLAEVPAALVAAGGRGFALVPAGPDIAPNAVQGFDLGHPSRPRAAGRWDADEPPLTDLAMAGRLAFAQESGADGVAVLDAAASPWWRSGVPEPGRRLAAREGLLARVFAPTGVDKTASLALYSVVDPARPVAAGRLDYSGRGLWQGIVELHDVALDGGLAYLAAGAVPTPPAAGTLTPTALPPGYKTPTPSPTPIGWTSPTPSPTPTPVPWLRIVDVADSGRPREVAVLGGEAALGRWVAAAGGLAAVQVDLGGGAKDVRVVDARTPHAPVEVARVAANPVQRPVLSGDRLVLLEASLRRVSVFSLADPRRPRLLAEWPAAGWAVRDLAARGPWLYVADSGFGLRIVDAARPGELLEVGGLALPGVRIVVAPEGQPAIVYVSDRQRLFAVDVSVPGRPRVVGRLSSPVDSSGGSALVDDLDTTAGYLVAAATRAGLWVVDISDPSAPRGVATLPLRSEPEEEVNLVAVDGPWVALASRHEQGLHVVDLAQPDRPRLLGSTGLGWIPRSLALGADHVYLGSLADEPGVHVFELGASGPPRKVGRVLGEGIVALAIADGLAFASGPRLHVLDLADPAAPQPLATVPVPWSSRTGLPARPLAIAEAAVFLGDSAGAGLTAIGRPTASGGPNSSPTPPTSSATATRNATPTDERRPTPTPGSSASPTPTASQTKLPPGILRLPRVDRP